MEVYGSIEKGGNGICSECEKEPARPNHFNCEKCAGAEPKTLKYQTIEEIQARIKEIRADIRKVKPKPDFMFEGVDWSK